MSLGILFPGQGINILQSLEDWLSESEKVYRWVSAAVSMIRLDLDALFKHGGRALQATDVFQPVLTGLSVGILEELEVAGSIKPSWVAGHSLGEIAALCCAGIMNGKQAVTIAALRGRWMGKADHEHPGGMLALLGCGQKSIDEALDLGRRRGQIFLAAKNAPDEWVLSGEERALKEVAARFKSVRLPVSGSFHGQSYSEAAQAFREELARMKFFPPGVGIVSSLTGRPLKSIEKLPDRLAEQLIRPILWSDTLSFMAASGVSKFLTIGPGKVMRGLVRKNLGNQFSVFGSDSPRELRQTMEVLTQ